MTTKKVLKVPQVGTQPATTLSPIDNMVSPTHTLEDPLKVPNKRPTSFSIDKNLLSQFKANCATKGKSMSSVIEDFIIKYVAEQ
jgi:hypothetical protein